jgi:hypothetical protein
MSGLDMSAWLANAFTAWYTDNISNLITSEVAYYPGLGAGPADDWFFLNMVEFRSDLLTSHPNYSAVAPFSVPQAQIPLRWSVAPQVGSQDAAMRRYRRKSVYLPTDLLPANAAGIAVDPASEGLTYVSFFMEAEADEYPDWNAWRTQYVASQADFDHSANIIVEYVTMPRMVFDPT